MAINTRFRSAEIADIVARSGARIIVLWPGFRQIDFMGILEGVDRASLDRVKRIVVYGDNDAGSAPFHDKAVLSYAALRDRPVYHDDLGDGPLGSNIFTTSGTTKAPKFVLHDHFSVVSHARNVARAFGYGA